MVSCSSSLPAYCSSSDGLKQEKKRRSRGEELYLFLSQKKKRVTGIPWICYCCQMIGSMTLRILSLSLSLSPLCPYMRSCRGAQKGKKECILFI